MDGKDKTKGQEEQAKQVRVRMRITCKNVKSIEKITSQIVESAKKIEGVQVKGPRRMPVKTLDVTCRRTPCGEGSKTWDHYELKIYKRVIDLVCFEDDIKTITSLTLEPGIDIDITIE